MKNKFAFIGKMFIVFDKKQRMQLLFLLLAIICSAMLELMGVTIILPFINIILSPEVITNGKTISKIYHLFNFHSTNDFLIFIAISILIVYICKNSFMLILNKMQFTFSFTNQRKLAYKIAEIYMGQNYLFHTKHNRAEIMRDVNADTSMFFRVVLCMLQFLTEVCVCGVLLVFLFITDKTITIGIAILMLIFILFYVKVFKNKIKYYGKVTRDNQAVMNQSLIQCFGGVKEIKILNCEGYFLRSFDDAYKEYANSLTENNILAVMTKPIVETLCIGGLMIVISVKLSMGVDMVYFVPTLTAFAVAAFRILPSFNKITNNLNSIIFGKPSIDGVYNTLQRIEKMEKIKKDNRKVEDLVFDEKILINNLSFRYPDTVQDVLHDVTFEIPKNKSIAFVGPSGAGKTTLADIILGIIHPSSGSIFVDGKDINENMISWQRKLGYIPQNIFLLDDTLRRNIAMGIPDEEIEDEKVWAAIRNAQLDRHVNTMEKGLDTIIGENGILLSGGQRQRIGIARALYHNPEILVLDEATSALDNDTEAAVMDAINSLSGTKTLIIIAHRLSTIEQCDIVYEVKNGCVNQK